MGRVCEFEFPQKLSQKWRAAKSVTAHFAPAKVRWLAALFMQHRKDRRFVAHVRCGKNLNAGSRHTIVFSAARRSRPSVDRRARREARRVVAELPSLVW